MNRNYIWIYILLIALIACSEDKSKYEDVLEDRVEKGGFNGNVLVYHDGKVILKKSHGLSNILTGDSLDVNSIFRLGSVSKQFTAMAVALLEEEGSLFYEQNIVDIIPELPYEGITVRHLLQHTSGLPDYLELMQTNWKPELGEDEPERYINGNDNIIQMMVQKLPEVHFDPGEKWEYSNTGYVLLATIVERVSGELFGKFLQERIFTPVGMVDTSVYNFVKGPDASMPMRVFGYSEENGIRKPNDAHFLNFAKGDGGVYSTLEDLLKWDRVLYTEQLVTNATLEKIFKEGKLNNGETFEYGFGWFIENDESDGKTVSHGGGWVGFGTYIYRDLKNNSSFIVLTNNSSWNEVEALVKEFKMIMSKSKV